MSIPTNILERALGLGFVPETPFQRLKRQYQFTDNELSKLVKDTDRQRLRKLLHSFDHLSLTDADIRELIKEIRACAEQQPQERNDHSLTQEKPDESKTLRGKQDERWSGLSNVGNGGAHCDYGETRFRSVFALLRAYLRLHGTVPSRKQFRELVKCGRETAKLVWESFFSLRTLGELLAAQSHISLISTQTEMKLLVNTLDRGSDNFSNSIQYELDAATRALFARHAGGVRMYRVSCPGDSDAAYIALALCADVAQERFLAAIQAAIGEFDYVAVWEIEEFTPQHLHWHAFVAASSHLTVRQFGAICRTVMREVAELTSVDVFKNENGTTAEFLDCFVSEDDWVFDSSRKLTYLAKDAQKAPRRLKVLGGEPVPPVVWGSWSSNLLEAVA